MRKLDNVIWNWKFILLNYLLSLTNKTKNTSKREFQLKRNLFDIHEYHITIPIRSSLALLCADGHVCAAAGKEILIPVFPKNNIIKNRE